MTREEAINKVRQMSLPKETMDILEELVPELAMSEDERMINELQGFLLSFGSDYFGTGEWQKFDDWLEKQKENIEKEYVFRPLAGTDINTAILQAIRRANEGDRLVLAFNGAYIPVTKGCDANKIVDIYDTFIEKQKEQQPAEKQDYSGLNDLERAILRGFLAAGVDNVPVGIIKETTKECLEQMGLQDPAHENDFVSKVWNKEDEEIMTDIIESLEYAYPYDNEIRNAWLKSLPERFNLQPKQEWSKEDEEMRDTCIDLLEHFPRPCGEVIGPWKDCIAWLKSLRSRKNSPIIVDADQLLKILPPPSWKPSEEQMKALHAASSVSSLGEYVQRHLFSLYKDLKKLIAKR